MFYSILICSAKILWRLHQFCLFQLASSVNCYAVWCIHFTGPLGGRSVLLFLTGQMYLSGSTFIKNIKSFVTMLLCLDNTSRKQNCKVITLSVILLVQTFVKVIVELGKTSKSFNCVLVLVIRPFAISNFLDNKRLWAIFPI